MCCDWHTSRYCHVRLGLCSWACELIPMASKSTSPPTLLHLHPFLSAALSSFLPQVLPILHSALPLHSVPSVNLVKSCALLKTEHSTPAKRVIHKLEPARATKEQTAPVVLFCLGTPLQMTRLIERNKAQLTEDRKTNYEARYGETSGRGNRD